MITISEITKALDKAFSLGSNYVDYADSDSYSKNKKAAEFQSKLEALKKEITAKVREATL